MMNASLLLFVIGSLVSGAKAFVIAPGQPTLYSLTSTTRLFGETTTAANDEQMTEKGLVKRDCYVATNRFAVRSGQQAKF